MLKVPAGEFQRNIGRYQDMALTQPIAVTRNGRERTVLISGRRCRWPGRDGTADFAHAAI
jgi:PHD/YefM family antitoxin component YafN of YafNO toxin-antitoxin module